MASEFVAVPIFPFFARRLLAALRARTGVEKAAGLGQATAQPCATPR